MTDEEYIKNISSISTEELFNQLEYYGYDSYYAGLWEATIEELKKRTEEREWTPVSEKLPDVDGGEYLVYRKTDAFIKRPFCIDIARWYSDDTENNGFNKYSEVIAWMPLPEPYRRKRMSDDVKRLIVVLQSKGQVITTEDVEYIAGAISENEWLGFDKKEEEK